MQKVLSPEVSLQRFLASSGSFDHLCSHCIIPERSPIGACISTELGDQAQPCLTPCPLCLSVCLLQQYHPTDITGQLNLSDPSVSTVVWHLGAVTAGCGQADTRGTDQWRLWRVLLDTPKESLCHPATVSALLSSLHCRSPSLPRPADFSALGWTTEHEALEWPNPTLHSWWPPFILSFWHQLRQRRWLHVAQRACQGY